MNKKPSSIRRKVLLTILFVLAVLMFPGLIACGDDQFTEDDVIAKGYKIAVVFDYGGGKSNDKTQVKIRLKEGSKVPNPSIMDKDLVLPGRAGYSFRRYSLAKTDENGSLLRDEDGNLIPDRAWDFDNDIPTGDITLIAEWWENYRIVLHYGEDYALTKSREVERTTDGLPTSVTKSAFTDDEYTFIDYFYDKAGTELIESVPMPLENERFADSADGLTLDVWGKTIKGDYKVIKKATDLLSFSFASGTNIYMYADVDMDELNENQSFSFPNEYSGEFLGNGKTIKNIKITQTASNNSDYYFGLFKEIGRDAKISNITFDNATLYADLAQPNVQQYFLGMFAGRVRENAKLTGVHVTGTIDYTVAAGYIDFEHLFVNEFIGTDQGAVKENCTGSMSIIASKAFFTADEQYAVYAKYTQNGEAVIVGDVYGIASKDGDGYSALRLRGDIEKDGDVYKLPSSNNVNYFARILQDGDSIVGEVTRTLAVFSSDSKSEYTVYFEHTEDSEGKMTLTDIYAVTRKDDNGDYQTVAISGEISYNSSNSTYTFTAEDGTAYSVKLVVENADRNRFSVEVTQNNG